MSLKDCRNDAQCISRATGLRIIEAVLARKAILLKEIDELIAERGEAAVLY